MCARRLGVPLALLLTAAMATGCGGTSPQVSRTSPGLVTGIAAMCSGPAGLPPHLVETKMLQGKRVVAHQALFGNRPFRLLVPPGKYIVTSDQSYAVPVQVTVRSGMATHADVNSACS